MSAPAAEVVLSAEGLVGGYVPEVDILRGCTLTAAEGEIVVVIGPNGAGKSTLAKAIFGHVKLREGKVVLRGKDITGAHTHEVTAQGMSYVPQVGNVFPSLTVQENLEVGGVLRRAQTRERMDTMMTLFPRLGERRRQRAGTLSGGERQMLAMARALMPDPAVLLLDRRRHQRLGRDDRDDRAERPARSRGRRPRLRARERPEPLRGRRRRAPQRSPGGRALPGGRPAGTTGAVPARGAYWVTRAMTSSVSTSWPPV